MKISVKVQLYHSHLALQKSPNVKSWLTQNIGMGALISSKQHWTHKVEDSFKENTQLLGQEKYYQDQISQLIDLLTNDHQSDLKVTIESTIVMVIHSKDLIDKLILHQVTSA